MTDLPTFSLDTPGLERNSVHSGHNFREVAPEVLSPLTWSIIGAGMERGFRDAADRFGRERPSGPRPAFVSYFGFRPYFNMTTVERLADELPVVAPEDIWALLLGGPAPDLRRGERPGRFHRWGRLRGALAFLGANAHAFGRAQAVLAKAEGATMDALSSDSPWKKGAACEAAVRAGRAAWALHIRTTCVAFVAASATKRILESQYDPDTAMELLRASAHRTDEDGGHASARGEGLTQGLDRLNNYEVADQGTDFTAFASVMSSAASVLNESSGRGRGGQTVEEVAIPMGTARGPLYERVVRFMRLALGERERSKEIGLRSLHCVRLLLDGGAFGYDPRTAAYLGIEEIRGLGGRAVDRLVHERAEELRAASELAYPVDVQVRADGLRPLRRSSATGANTGYSLAPGWAEGVLCAESDGEPDRVLVGDRVDGNYVLAVMPSGVVTKYGSMLSHVAIVCRELGIPCVAGVELRPGDLGKRATVDGWSGVVAPKDESTGG
ncbi:PEP-utilizing enzyme [Nocardiopsis alborubida]|uniref:PEP-utilising enzyme mobile domain-containing protein n=1 Tax=Nocardiopsis alborubida TaxID=146802 RepID=A0A7X6RNZ2_9ACTN|nr:PEP-utilizing enzyme [Nocardiopsis alborubida]NKY97194.1 hypothetical protein [Nocardiopsis alborubida]